MILCKTCVMPNTRPDTPFTDGECSACISHKNRPNIDWDARKEQLLNLLDKHHGQVIVPSSGGKDSTYQVLTLLELGADVTIVTATTCHLTDIGRKNIDNLARYARTIEVSPHKTVRAKLHKLGLSLVGDISWPEHVSIFTTPFKMAKALGINLIMYGENPQSHYGGPEGADQAFQLTTRWRSEFGGFLGLRPSDMIGQLGITVRDMKDYELPVDLTGIEAHFLGQYIPWDSDRNAQIAIGHGMSLFKPFYNSGEDVPARANWWVAENLDNAQTGIHDLFGYLKYGYGRGCAQISVDIRNKIISREDALKWVKD